MKSILSKEHSILIAPLFIVALVFVVPISSSLKSILAVLSLIAIVLTPYYRAYLYGAFNTVWGKAAVVFFLYIVIASLWSHAPVSMRLDVIDKYSKLIYLPILAVGFIHPRTRNWALNTYFLVMLITCFMSLLKYNNIISINNSGDSGEVFYNHIATGFMVALAVYFAASLLCFQKNLNKWMRAYYMLMVFFGTYQIFFLNTGRTGYFIYGILISLLIVQKLPLKKAIVGLIAFAGILGLIYSLSPVLQERTAVLISDIKFLQKDQKHTSVGFRVQFHDYARSLFKQHPFIGIGTGGFKYQYAIDDPVPDWEMKELHDPHSQYWLLLSEQGTLGIILFCLFIGTLFITAFQLNKKSRAILLGMLVSFCVGSVSDTILCYSTMGTLLILFSALCLGELIEKRAAKALLHNKASSSPSSGALLA